MSAGMIETYPIGIRGYQLSPKPEQIELITERGRPVWVVQPLRPDECRIYVASREDAEECLRGVVEGLR